MTVLTLPKIEVSQDEYNKGETVKQIVRGSADSVYTAITRAMSRGGWKKLPVQTQWIALISQGMPSTYVEQLKTLGYTPEQVLHYLQPMKVTIPSELQTQLLEVPEKELEFYPVEIPLNIPYEDLQEILLTMPTPKSSEMSQTEKLSNTRPVRTTTSSDLDQKLYTIKNHNNPVHVQMWKYPAGKVNIVNFQDKESLRLFQEKINQYKSNGLKGKVYQDYIYSNRPLAGALNDSIFVTYAYSPTTQKFEKVKEIYKPLEASIAKGEHTKEGVKNVIISSNPWLHNTVGRSDSKVPEYTGKRDLFLDITINPNLPFSYHGYKAEDPRTGMPYEFLSYSVDYDYSDRLGPLRNPIIYRSNLSSANSNPLTNVSTTQSATQNTTNENNTSGSNTGIMNNVLSFFSKLKKQSGGTLNYFDYFN